MQKRHFLLFELKKSWVVALSCGFLSKAALELFDGLPACCWLLRSCQLFFSLLACWLGRLKHQFSLLLPFGLKYYHDYICAHLKEIVVQPAVKGRWEYNTTIILLLIRRTNFENNLVSVYVRTYTYVNKLKYIFWWKLYIHTYTQSKQFPPFSSCSISQMHH